MLFSRDLTDIIYFRPFGRRVVPGGFFFLSIRDTC